MMDNCATSYCFSNKFLFLSEGHALMTLAMATAVGHVHTQEGLPAIVRTAAITTGLAGLLWPGRSLYGLAILPYGPANSLARTGALLIWGVFALPRLQGPDYPHRPTTAWSKGGFGSNILHWLWFALKTKKGETS